MTFNEDYKISIQFLKANKQYGAKQFLKEFPEKGWSLGGLKKLVKKIDTTGTAASVGRI